ncbi:hypothetical protein [Nonomuraea sp. NPDC046570]|uniref:hypothetical protein n=1 Tax=Nonomuraea sp. NPDC046570 TaxID=3155255 RepID=UPI0033CB7FDD
MRPRPVSRRAVLAGAAALAALSGCTAGEPEPTAAPAPDPEHVLLRDVIAEKERTIALYSALIDGGATKLTPFRARHQAHLAELRERLPRAAPLPSGTPTATPSPSPAAKPSLTRLRDLERRSAALRARQLTEVSPALSQLLASIGACEATHALALPRSV